MKPQGDLRNAHPLRRIVGDGADERSKPDLKPARPPFLSRRDKAHQGRLAAAAISRAIAACPSKVIVRRRSKRAATASKRRPQDEVSGVFIRLAICVVIISRSSAGIAAKRGEVRHLDSQGVKVREGEAIGPSYGDLPARKGHLLKTGRPVEARIGS